MEKSFRERERRAEEDIDDIFLFKPKRKRINREISEMLEERGGY